MNKSGQLAEMPDARETGRRRLIAAWKGGDRVGKRIWNEAPPSHYVVPVSGARSDACRIEPNPSLYLGISRETDVASRVK